MSCVVFHMGKEEITKLCVYAHFKTTHRTKRSKYKRMLKILNQFSYSSGREVLVAGPGLARTQRLRGKWRRFGFAFTPILTPAPSFSTTLSVSAPVTGGRIGRVMVFKEAHLRKIRENRRAFILLSCVDLCGCFWGQFIALFTVCKPDTLGFS